MFGQNRDQIRLMFVNSWHKAQNNEDLQPLERIIAEIIEMHPEYQSLLSDQDSAIGNDYLPEFGETNPFLHMGLHISIREQLGTDRPTGIREAYQALVKKHADAHEAEHQLLEILGETLWLAQRNGTMPDEQAYLEKAQIKAGIKHRR